jgi:hypothetical protein
MSDTAVSLLAPFINNAGATVIMIVFLLLWHKRTAARDKYFFETLQAINTSLMECVSKMKE